MNYYVKISQILGLYEDRSTVVQEWDVVLLGIIYYG